MTEKYCIIADEIHTLIKIKDIKSESWNMHAWAIHDKDNLYWVPVADEKRIHENKCFNADPECPRCRRKWATEAYNL